MQNDGLNNKVADFFQRSLPSPIYYQVNGHTKPIQIDPNQPNYFFWF